jgi:autotransporter-associated beta strand protein
VIPKLVNSASPIRVRGTSLRVVPLACALVVSAWSAIGHAQSTRTWSSTTTNVLWSVAGNWTSGTAPVANDSLAFNATTGSTTLTNDMTAATQFNGITFNSGASAYTLTGNQITLGGAVTNNSANLQRLSLPLALSATQTFNAASGGLTLSGVVSGAGGLAKTGTATLNLAGASANTYSGTTTVSAGVLNLNKTAGVTAVPGSLAISSAIVTFGTSNQIADSAAVTISGTGSFFNSTSFNAALAGNLALDETIGSLAVTGGVFFPGGIGSTTGFTVTGSASFTGGDGNTEYVQNSGGLASYGSLSLAGMTSTAEVNGGFAVPNRFVVAGNNSTRQSTLTVGSGGLSLDGSNLLLQLGSGVALGSRLVLNGDVTTTGAAASSIRAPAGETNSIGSRAVELSGTSGTVTRTFTVGGGANLTVAIPITNGSATTAGLTKAGAGILTLGTANSYNGATTISAGTLALGLNGSFGSSPTIRVGNAGSSGAVLDLTAKTGTFAFTSSQTVGGIGTIRMDAGDTARFAGILAPGNSAGILTFDGGTGLLSGTTQIEIFGASRGTGYDAIDLVNAATLDYGNGVLALDFGSWLASPQSYQLFGSGSSSLLGDFSSVTIAGTNYAGLTFSGSNGVWTSQGTSPANQTLTFTEATGTLVIVPEPAAIALAGIGIAAAACALRRRRKSPPCSPSPAAAA